MGKLPVDFRAAMQARRTGREEGVTCFPCVLKLPSKRMKSSCSRVKREDYVPWSQPWCLGCFGVWDVLIIWPWEQGSRGDQAEREVSSRMRIWESRRKEEERETWQELMDWFFSWYLGPAGACFNAHSRLSQQVKWTPCTHSQLGSIRCSSS